MPIHRTVEAEGIPVHVVEEGPPSAPPVLLLHGWPECWFAFDPVMRLLGREAHVVAMDLPGIGGSRVPPASGDKRTLARIVRGVLAALHLERAMLVGHDIGGQIVYAFLRAHPGEIGRAVIMDVVVPGVDPWQDVLRNPRIWHFGLHAVPDLPELLVSGREAAYFRWFYDAIAARPGVIAEESQRAHVEAYARPEALRAGFDWYRAFPRDAQDNAAVRGEAVETPVLYVRGDREPGGMDRYLAGLADSGLRHLRGHVIRESGHFAPEEQPEQVAEALRDFLRAAA